MNTECTRAATSATWNIAIEFPNAYIEWNLWVRIWLIDSEGIFHSPGGCKIELCSFKVRNIYLKQWHVLKLQGRCALNIYVSNIAHVTILPGDIEAKDGDLGDLTPGLERCLRWRSGGNPQPMYFQGLRIRISMLPVNVNQSQNGEGSTSIEVCRIICRVGLYFPGSAQLWYFKVCALTETEFQLCFHSKTFPGKTIKFRTLESNEAGTHEPGTI